MTLDAEVGMGGREGHGEFTSVSVNAQGLKNWPSLPSNHLLPQQQLPRSLPKSWSLILFREHLDSS